MALPTGASPAGGVTRLADAEPVEQATIAAMLQSSAWSRRALALLRLERFDCPESLALIAAQLDEPQWHLRAFAVRSLSARGADPPEGWVARESEPRVLLTALRAGWPVQPERLQRGFAALARAADPADRLLAVELAKAGRDPQLQRDADDLLLRVVMQLDRTSAGSLGPRLRRLTGAPALRLPHQWRDWFRRHRRTMEVTFPTLRSGETELPAVARLPVDQFVALEQYMEQIASRRIDLAVLIDCTGSMSGDLGQVQAGVDDLMEFIGGVADRLRVAIVAYRDRNDPEFEVRPWDFSADVTDVRRALWSLSADGGGDRPEAVHPALRTAYTQLSWNPTHTRILVLIGDAPPHVGLGAHCVAMAGAAAENGLISHAIQTRLRRDRTGARTLDVEHFPEIAEAGNGRCVTLQEGTSLVAEIAGLTVGDRFSVELGEFYRLYLDLCR